MACASSDGKVSILSKIGEEWQSQVISAHMSGCNSVAWCPSGVSSSLLALDFSALDKKAVPVDSKMIATGGCDNTVKIWKAVETENGEGIKEERWQLEVTLTDHSDWVRDVCWRPSMGQTGKMLVSCSQDFTVLVWKQEKETGKWKSAPLKSEPFPDTLWRVSFSEYGHLLAVSCGDNTVTLWREEAEDGTWKLVGNVDENVTETVKIDEPLAVTPPVAVPIPEINFTSTGNHVVNGVGYMKPMSPVIPLTTLPGATGYNQIDEDYDNYQHAQTPTVPSVDVYNHEMLATAVVPDIPATYAGAQVEFNKDIGFVSPATNVQEPMEPDQQQYDSQKYESPGGYSYEHAYELSEQTQNTYEANGADQPAYESYEQQTTPYADNQYETGQYENNYEYGTDQYGGSSIHEEQRQYEDQHLAQYDQQAQGYNNFDQQTQYGSSGIDQHESQEAQQAQYDQAQYEQSHYEQSTYEQPQYEEYKYADYQSPEQAQPQGQVDYTLQYEGYQSQSYNNSDSTNL